MFPEMHIVRFMLLDDLAGGEVFGEAPDEIHLHVNGRQRHPRLEDEQHAAVEEEACPEECDDDGDPTIARARDGDNPDGDARRDEDAERQVEDGHRALEDARAAGQLVELGEDDGPSVFQQLDLAFGLRQLLQPVRERADAIDDAPEPRRSGEDHRPAGRDQHGGRNHGRQNGQG